MIGNAEARKSSFEKLLATEVTRLPPVVRAELFAQPVLSLEVIPDGDGFALKDPARLSAVAERDVFCKLAIKSWRDAGSIRPIYRGLPLRDQVGVQLAEPTPQQRVVARAWSETGVPLQLHLTPYVDFSDVSEVRWLTGSDGVQFVSACRRGRSAGVLGKALPAMRELAVRVASAMPVRDLVVEIACLPNGDVRLVEVNPGLTPAEIRGLVAG